MKSAHRLTRVIAVPFVLVSALLLTSHASLAGVSKNPCARSGADAALRAGDLLSAEAAYATLEQGSAPHCAVQGALKVESVENAILGAVALEISGLHDSASSKVEAIQTAYPSADFTSFLDHSFADATDPTSAVHTVVALNSLGFVEAADHLLATTASKLKLPVGFSNPLLIVNSAGPFAAAVLLERVGLHEEALAEFNSVLSSDPDGAAVALSANSKPSELATLLAEANEGNTPPFWASFKRRVTPWAKAIGELLVLLLLAMFLLRLVKAALRSPTEIHDFQDSDVESGTKSAKDLTALVRTIVYELGADLPASSLEVVTSLEAAAPTLPDSFASNIPDGQFAAAVVDLLQKVLPQRGWVVSGQLLAKSARGVGVALRLASAKGRVRAEVTLWDSECSPTPGDDVASESVSEHGEATSDVSTYDNLAMAAAVWITYQMIEILYRDNWSLVAHPLAHLRLERGVRLLPTLDWRSYMHFAIGARSLRDTTAAARSFERALQLDPANAAALFNLATLDIQEGHWEGAEDRLNRLGEWLADEPARQRIFLWYRCQYMTAVLQMSRELSDRADGRSPKTEPFELAQQTLARSLKALEEQLDLFWERKSRRYRFPSSRERSRSLFQNLVEFEGAFVLALAGATARLEVEEAAVEGVEVR